MVDKSTIDRSINEALGKQNLDQAFKEVHDNFGTHKEEIVAGMDAVEEHGKTNKLLFESSMKPNTSRHFATLLGNEVWHTDSTYTPVSSKCALLQAMELPSTGGETEFADARAAYDDLDADMKRKIEHLNAYHSLHYSMAKARQTGPAFQE